MKKLFLKNLPSSQKSTFARVSFLFGQSSVYISNVSVAVLNIYLFPEKGRKKQLLLFESLKHLAQHINTYKKLATVTLKQDVKFVES